MSWFRVDDKFHSHVKAIRCGLDALGLWTLAGSYCMDHMTDGVVDREVVERLAGPSFGVLATQLERAGLWREHERGWTFHDWLDRQPSKKEIIEKRDSVSQQRAAAGRKSGESRKAKAAKKSRTSTPNKQGTNGERAVDASLNKPGTSEEQTGTPSHTHPIPILSNPPNPPEGGRDGTPASAVMRAARVDTEAMGDGSFGMSADWYCEAVAKGSGRPVTRLAPGERGDLARMVEAHAGGRVGAALEEWLREAGEAFGRAADPAFGLRPRHCIKFLEADRKVPQTGARGRIVQKSAAQYRDDWVATSFDEAARAAGGSDGSP